MKRRSESGFAMLLVFVLAAAIAISLYMEMPRVAVESQRFQGTVAGAIVCQHTGVRLFRQSQSEAGNQPRLRHGV